MVKTFIFLYKAKNPQNNLCIYMYLRRFPQKILTIYVILIIIMLKEVMDMFFLMSIQNEKDRLLIEQLFYKYKNLMFQQAYGILQDCQLSEDAVQESFIKIINNLHKINKENCPQTRNFLVIICENTAKDMLKKKTYLNNDNTEIDDLKSYDEQSNPIEFSVNKDTIKRISNIVKEMNPIYKDLFLLKIYHDCSNQEISSLLNLSTETVKKRLYRGRKILSEILEKEGLRNG